MQQRLDKPFYDLGAGLVTEAGPLNTPDGATVDEQNFHVFIDRSRRRRRGLVLEENGTVVPRNQAHVSEVSRVGKWKNAGGSPDNDMVVVQAGATLHFFKDEGTEISGNALPFTISLTQFSTQVDPAVVAEHPVSMASGNGILVVTGRYVEPFYLEFRDDAIVATRIPIRIRDFVGASPELLNFTLQPKTLTSEHEYNLRNRGWRDEDITAYFGDEGRYPSLNMLWHKGYAREVDDTAYINEDGVRKWNSTKISAEPFGNQSAPQGSLFINPFDTSEGSSTFDDPVEITTWDWEVSSGKWLITATTSLAHGFSVLDKFNIAGQVATYTMREVIDGPIPFPLPPDWEPPYVETYAEFRFNGVQTALGGTEDTTITFRVDPPFNFYEWINQYEALGYLDTGRILERPNPYITSERPLASAWYAGRWWVAGVAAPELADKIMFSQLVRHPADLGKFYMYNDPTNEALNQLLATDGGVIELSDVGNIEGLLPYQNVLLILADNGVWEVAGARGGVFTPDNFSIRKITDSGCTSPWGFVEAEGRVLFSGTNGVFTIQPDEHTGILYAISLTEQSIQREWSRIPPERQKVAKMAYDNVNKQAWIIYQNSTASYHKALVYDLRLTAWHKMVFSDDVSSGTIQDIFVTRDSVGCGRFSNLKFVILSEDELSLMDICRGNRTEDIYKDWTGEEVQAFLTMGPDALGSWQHRRQAPVVHVYSRRTTLKPGENESSIKMRAQWDWTDSSVAGKWGSTQEVHRVLRPFVPLDLDEPLDDGYPVVVTRNKVRGRGRALQLRFESALDKDAHLLGYAVRYHVSGRV